uniref:Uncharacterized protein n=1 Tax=Timema bartmani TaxID=61472 RepID=A0A7R9EUV6_9NEOP|nr:unnamed protein product [Timema bartmani]
MTYEWVGGFCGSPFWCTHLCVERVENHFEGTTLSTPDRDLNLNIPVISSLVYCEGSALDHAATEELQSIAREFLCSQDECVNRVKTVHPTEIRNSISQFSAVELNTSSALANYATEAELTTERERYKNGDQLTLRPPLNH